jgi:hypothetical protein
MIHALQHYERITSTLHKNIKAAKAYPSLLTNQDHAPLRSVLDKALWNYLSSLDLVTELKFLDASLAVGNQFEANFFARITALSCFEILDTRNSKVGKDIRSLALGVPGGSALKRLDECVRKLNRLAAEKSPQLKALRNNLFGHRMKAGRAQAVEMLLVQPKAIYEVGSRILEIQFELADAFMELAKDL